MNKKGNKMIAAAAAAFIIGAAGVLILPPSSGELTNRNNTEICEKTFLDINGAKIGMTITGNTDKPVLLFLGGGPAIPQYMLEYYYPTGLDEQFIVCMPSYRGTVLSYDKDLDKSTVTREQYIQDALAVTDYLCERFDTDKVYLMGHSFGTGIGLELSFRYPERYTAYIAMSQITDQPASEKMAYEHMKEICTDKALLKELESYSDAFGDGFDMRSDRMHTYFAKTRDKAMHSLGVGTTREMRSVITEIFFPSLRMTDFTQTERINIWQGKAYMKETPLDNDSFTFNAEDITTHLDIPYYMFAGVYDYTTAYPLQKEYFERIDAPVKEFYSFENSAHSPLYEEPVKAKEILERIKEQNNG